MRTPDDKILAEEVEGLDLILGGHDHLSVAEVVDNCPVIKSGSDFKEITKINVGFDGVNPFFRSGLNMAWETI